MKAQEDPNKRPAELTDEELAEVSGGEKLYTVISQLSLPPEFIVDNIP